MAAKDSESTAETQCRVVVLGAPGVGKTTIVRAWAGEAPPYQHVPTSGVEIHRIPLKDSNVMLEVHDVGSEATGREVERSLEGADAVALVYDCRRMKETLAVLVQDWMPRVRLHVSDLTAHFLVANAAYSSFTHPELQAFQALPPLVRKTLCFYSLTNVQEGAKSRLEELYTFTVKCLRSRDGYFKGESHSKIDCNRHCCCCFYWCWCCRYCRRCCGCQIM